MGCPVSNPTPDDAGLKVLSAVGAPAHLAVAFETHASWRAVVPRMHDSGNRHEPSAIPRQSSVCVKLSATATTTATATIEKLDVQFLTVPDMIS